MAGHEIEARRQAASMAEPQRHAHDQKISGLDSANELPESSDLSASMRRTNGAPDGIERRHGQPDRRKSFNKGPTSIGSSDSLHEDVFAALQARTKSDDQLSELDAANRTRYDALMLTLDHVGRGVQMIDRTGRLILANAQSAEMLGVSHEFLAAQPMFLDLIKEQWRCNENGPMPEALQQELVKQLTSRNRETYQRRSHNGRVVEVTSIPLVGGGVVRTHTDITSRYEAEERVRHMASHDYLTGLANRASFEDAVDEATKASDGFSILLIDLDYFKRANDTHGHRFGDALLQEVARRVSRSVRIDDAVARIGGDEMAIVVRKVPSDAVGERIAAEVVAAMAAPFVHEDKSVVPSVSVGVATITSDVTSPVERGQAVWYADLALYQSKENGRGRWQPFNPDMAKKDRQQRELFTELRMAVDQCQFEVYYQPVVAIGTRRIAGFEALLRWNHPLRGVIAAAEFLPTVENTGLIDEVGRWVIEQACRDAAGWPCHIRVLVNLSPRQLLCDDVLGFVRGALAAAGIPAERLELEITETSMIQTSGKAERVVAGLRAMGVHIALDDFGTGFSSLSHIKTMHFDTIKIDRSFIKDAADNIACGAIVRAVVSIATDLGIGTVAEGIETTDQLDWIRGVGCNEAQGYLFSRPVPAATAHDIALSDAEL